MSLNTNPFEHDKLLGAISEIGPNYVRAAFVIPMTSGQKFLHGQSITTGQVGDFVLIDGQDRAIFGKVTRVRLPDKDRRQVEPSLEDSEITKPVADIQLLASISLIGGNVVPGITKYPQIGARVFIAPANILQILSSSNSQKISLTVAHLPSSTEHEISISPEKLFGRHCAVLGATGGGKSWTVARLVEQAKGHKAKVILFDPSGEFWRISGQIKNVHIGDDPTPKCASTEVVVPYSSLTESDLLALFNPSGQTQAPKLRAAMKSLKLAKISPKSYPDGYIQKAGLSKVAHDKLFQQNSKTIERPFADFDISHLAKQIQEECVYPSGFAKAGGPDHSIWGGHNQAEVGYVVPLLARIEDMIQSPDLNCLFELENKASIFSVIDEFLKDNEHSCLRISFKNLSFAYNVREIVCNSIGRHLLRAAREHKFKEKPLVVFVDEAHQFLNKHIGDDNFRFPLDAFDLIAKEGRKYCLNVCIATQRPRDIPEGVLSQMGTLIVHRLINDKDREVVERASGEIDKSAAAFLPTLSQGQAIIVGVDFPAPLTVQIMRPSYAPDSDGPKYQECWK
jgi:hypothetical protein